MIIPDTLNEVVKWNGGYHQRRLAIKHFYRRTTESYLALGKLLDDADKAKDWMHDGSMAKSHIHWCENEMGIKRSTAQRLMTVWKTFAFYIENYHDLVLSVDFSKLAMIAPYFPKITSEDEKIELIHAAVDLSVRALENNLRESNGLIATDNCNHDFKIKTVEKCGKCGLVIIKEKPI